MQTPSPYATRTTLPARIYPKQAMIQLLDKLASISLVVIDESFIDFSTSEEPASVQAEAIQRPNVIVLKSLGNHWEYMIFV